MEQCTKIYSDYANQRAKGAKTLSKVGIKNFKQRRTDFNGDLVMSTQLAYIDIHERNGAHMSRLVSALIARNRDTLCLDNDLLYELRSSHKDCGAKTSYWGCSWESVQIMPNDQELLIGVELAGSLIRRTPKWFLTTFVPYTSVCPCSAEMVEEAGYGHPHMQRAGTKITGELDPEEDLSETLTMTVATVQRVVGLIPQPFMKRPDELEWCKNAQDNRFFVEDAARLIADSMDDLYEDYVVECTHNESIHLHDVFAMHRKGRKLL